MSSWLSVIIYHFSPLLSCFEKIRSASIKLSSNFLKMFFVIFATCRKFSNQILESRIFKVPYNLHRVVFRKISKHWMVVKARMLFFSVVFLCDLPSWNQWVTQKFIFLGANTDDTYIMKMGVLLNIFSKPLPSFRWSV